MAKFVITKPYTAKSRPIIFNGEMVRAILDGRKIQTRRVIKKDFMINPEEKYPYYIRGKYALWNSFKTLDELVVKFCPHGKPGDFLWVRETWATHPFDNKIKPSLLPRDTTVYYRADYLSTDKKHFNWRPSIFMPRWVSRITLEITDIKVKRLKSISLQDIQAEGVTNGGNMFEEFHKLWDSINAKRGYSWESDPWVWIIEFIRIDEKEGNEEKIQRG